MAPACLSYMRRSGFWLLAALAGIVTAAPASATVTEALELEELVTRADVIVVAEVTGQRALRDPRGRIVTDVTLRVDETMKGAPVTGDQVKVRCLGGTIGDIGMRVPGEPSFRNGERRLLFGRHGQGSRLRPVGMAQGALPVRQQDGRTMVMPAAQNLSLVRQTGGRVVQAPPAVLHPRPLGVLRNEIRDLVRNGAER